MLSTKPDFYSYLTQIQWCFIQSNVASPHAVFQAQCWVVRSRSPVVRTSGWLPQHVPALRRFLHFSCPFSSVLLTPLILVHFEAHHQRLLAGVRGWWMSHPPLTPFPWGTISDVVSSLKHHPALSNDQHESLSSLTACTAGLPCVPVSGSLHSVKSDQRICECCSMDKNTHLNMCVSFSLWSR